MSQKMHKIFGTWWTSPIYMDKCDKNEEEICKWKSNKSGKTNWKIIWHNVNDCKSTYFHMWSIFAMLKNNITDTHKKIFPHKWNVLFYPAMEERHWWKFTSAKLFTISKTWKLIVMKINRLAVSVTKHCRRYKSSSHSLWKNSDHQPNVVRKP